MSALKQALMNRIVLVSALGYFVDIYDLVLFSIVRVASLRDLGVAPEDLLSQGVFLINMQMAGMLIGGFFWGILGDKRGRLAVLFGSILIYSIANIANAYVTSIEAYAFWRLLAGFGLAGELGAAVTLVSESLPQSVRGYGTSLVAGVGVAGAIAAAVVAEHSSWQAAYVAGGVMGLLLLLLRVSLFEPGMFQAVKERKDVARGNIMALFRSRRLFGRYMACILIGVPLWYVVGILITFSPEICRALGVQEPISAGQAILWNYAGLVVGDLASGVISQWWRSRKKVVATFLGLTAGIVGLFLTTRGLNAFQTYAFCFALGCTCGYWAMFVQIAAEQFGTNLRATVTTTAPNMVRGSVLLLTSLLHLLKGPFGLIAAAGLVGVICFVTAFVALSRLPESFHRDLDFVE